MLKIVSLRFSTLITLVVPEGVKTIEKGQFEGMFALTSVTLPSSLESIGESILQNWIM